MKIPETIATQEELVKQQVRYYTLLNGYLSAGFWIALTAAIFTAMHWLGAVL